MSEKIRQLFYKDFFTKNTWKTILALCLILTFISGQTACSNNSVGSENSSEATLQEKTEVRDPEVLNTQTADDSWSLIPEIEADDIYYLNSNDIAAVPRNYLNKQMDKDFGYAVLKKGDSYALINMDGKVYQDLYFSDISTHLGYYHVSGDTPIDDPDTGKEIFEADFMGPDEGMKFPYEYGDSYGLEGGVMSWDHGLCKYYLYNEMPDPREPVPIYSYEDQILREDISSDGSRQVNPDELDKICNEMKGKCAVYYPEYSRDYLLTDYEYDDCGSFSDGLLAVRKNGKWGYINKEGEEIIPIEYDASWDTFVPYENIRTGKTAAFCYAATGGYVVLKKGDSWLIKDTAGSTVIDEGKYEALRPVHNGKCWAKKNGKWGVIKISGSRETDSGLTREKFIEQTSYADDDILYFIKDDYNGDGIQEAYVIIGKRDEEGFSQNVEFYYMSPKTGEVGIINFDDEMYGWLHLDDDGSPLMMDAGNHKFIIWEKSAGGSSSRSYIFGVKDPEDDEPEPQPYEPEISGEYMDFAFYSKEYAENEGVDYDEENGGHFVGIKDYFDPYHKYDPVFFAFDNETGEFFEENN